MFRFDSWLIKQLLDIRLKPENNDDFYVIADSLN